MKYFHSKVEAAVEEERRRGVELLAKERLGLERARREAGAEREQLGRDREALEQQRASLQQTRAREADIVNKLQVTTDYYDKWVCVISGNWKLCSRLSKLYFLKVGNECHSK